MLAQALLIAVRTRLPAVCLIVVSTAWALCQAFGGVDVLVKNARITDGMTAAHDVTDKEWDRVLRVNLTAPSLLARAVVPPMLAKDKGTIVDTASQASLRGSAAGTACTVSRS